MEQNTFLTAPVKMVLAFTILILTGLLLVVVGNPFEKMATPVLAPTSAPIQKINQIGIAEAKLIYDLEAGKTIFTNADAQKYLVDSEYAYNPDTFQDTNAKYAGDCFLDAGLSNNKDRIVFSTGCLAGDLPQAWIGIYNINWGSDKNTNCANANCLGVPKFKILAGGSGRNFIWSADDKTITYEADLGLSGLTEIRTIDSVTGEILKNN